VRAPIPASAALAARVNSLGRKGAVAAGLAGKGAAIARAKATGRSAAAAVLVVKEEGVPVLLQPPVAVRAGWLQGGC